MEKRSFYFLTTGQFFTFDQNLKHHQKMKKLVLIVFVILFYLPGQSQILRSIANSAAHQAKSTAADKASEKVNKEVDKGVSKFFDGLAKEDTTQKVKETPGKAAPENGNQAPASVNNFMKRMGVSTEVPPHKELYKFSAQIVSITEGTDEKGKKIDPVESTIAFDEKTSDAMFKTKTQGNSSNAILDSENSCMIMLNEADGQKTGFATKFTMGQNGQAKAPNTTEAEGKDEEPECKMAKTGKTKNISGFNCSEYRCETEKEISVAWITKDFSAKNNKIFGSSAFGANYKTEGFDGMVIQYEFYSKSDKSSSIMTIKSIDMNKSSSCSLAGYQISGLNINMK